jgi:hypothetical protein
MRVWAVPVQKMVIFSMPGQMADAAETEEAINKFISGLDSQEHAGFDRLHRLLSRLPVPVTVATNGSKMSHTAALDGDFLPKWMRNSRRGFSSAARS